MLKMILCMSTASNAVRAGRRAIFHSRVAAFSILTLLLSSPQGLKSFTSSYACVNGSGDPAGIQSAVNTGGLATITGTCAMGTSTVSIGNAVSVIGGAQFNSTSSGKSFAITSNNVSFTGMIFNGAFITVGNNLSVTGQITNVNFINNTFQNYLNPGDTTGAIYVNPIWKDSQFTGNSVRNVWNGGYGNTNASNINTTLPLNSSLAQSPNALSGLFVQGGIDNVTVQFNTFAQISHDGFKGFWNGLSSNTGGYIAPSSNVSYNIFSQIRGIAVELQSQSGACVGGCNFARANIAGFIFNGNLVHSPVYGFYNTFAYSVVFLSTNQIDDNDAAITDYTPAAPASSFQGYAFELPPGTPSGTPLGSGQWNGLIVSGEPNNLNKGWGNAFQAYNPPASGTIQMQNIVQCGIGNTDNTLGKGTVPAGYNYTQNHYASSCGLTGAALYTSNISQGWDQADNQNFPSGGSGTWNMHVFGLPLPIRWVQFYLDGAATPFATQEIQTVSNTFPSDQLWRYGTTINTSGLASGSHTITAITTDVSGSTAGQTQHFTVGSGTSPVVQFTPTSLTFGSFQTGTSSTPQNITLQNTGLGTLTLALSITGTNAADYSQTNTCGSSLAAGASCNISVTFTPSATGTRTASVSMTDNASGSPHTVAMTGMGSASVGSCPGSILPNCAFTTGALPPWTFGNGSTSSTAAVDASGACAINSAHVTAASIPMPFTSSLELKNSNLTLGANGTVYSASITASVTRAQQIKILLVSTVPDPTLGFVAYALPWTPTLATGCNTYTTTFTIQNSPSAGAASFAIQAANAGSGDSLWYSNVILKQVSTLEVNNIIFPADHIGHSSVWVSFTSQTVSNASRIRYIQTSAGTCKTGTGGYVVNNFQTAVSATSAAYGIGGLAPNTQIEVCPEVSKDGGSTWSTGAGGTVTTAALPNPHPSLPIAPEDFDTDYPGTFPNPSGYYVDNTLLPDCSNIGTVYPNAVSRWATQGTVINFAAGTNCSTFTNLTYSGQPPDVHTWQPTDVTLPSTITWTAHGFSENDRVKFGRSYRSSTNYPTSTSCAVGFNPQTPGGIQTGPLYPVHVIDADHFQVRCLSGTQIDPAVAAPTPPIMVFTDTGSSSSGGFYAVPFKNTGTTAKPKWARRLPNGNLTPKIIFQVPTCTVPEHTQITPAWESQMAKWIDPVANISNAFASPSKQFISVNDTDDNYERIYGAVRIGPCIEITTADYATSVRSSDPWFWNYVMHTSASSDDVVWDRVYYKMLGTPNREQIGFYWQGSHQAILDSYWSNLIYGHAANDGLNLARVDATHFTIATGTAHALVANIPLASTVTVTLSGSGSGRVRAYFDLLSSNALTIAVPSGITASCSGATCASASSAGTVNGQCLATLDTTNSENASDAWPKTANGEVTVAQIGCADVTSGSITTAGPAYPFVSLWNPEGDSHMLGGIGPGPYKMIDNYSCGAGITWHWDDGGVSGYRGNYNIWRNYLCSDLKWMHGSSTSDGLNYAHRQIAEHKGGQNIWMHGNVWDTTWRETTPDGAFYAATPVLGGIITDLNMEYNTFRHGSAVTEGPFTTCDENKFVCAPPVMRSAFRNNLSYDINGYKYTANASGLTYGLGWSSQLYGLEDHVEDHNTYGYNGGQTPWMASDSGMAMEGYQRTNGLEWYSGVTGQTNTNFGDGTGGLPPPGCLNLTDVNFLNCAMTQGPGVTAFNMSQNMIAGGYSDTSGTPSGQSNSSTLSTAFNGLNNSYFATGTVPGTVSAIKWWNPAITNQVNYRLNYQSPYNAGNNGFDHSATLGAFMDELDSAQGNITLIGTPESSITSSSFVVAYQAADSAVDYVLYSQTNDITTATQIADAGGARKRNTTVSGLASHTTIYYWVLGSGNSVMSQRSGIVKTH